jgi:hypothetical protein
MSVPQIPDESQIRALLDGSIYDLLRQYFGDANPSDFRKAISVDRRDVVEFLNSRPAEADAYFAKHSAIQGNHDVERIWREGSSYLTCWMDHDQQRSVRSFATLPEAIAEHVLVMHGMY